MASRRGVVATVVASAMMTSIAKSVGEITWKFQADVQYDQFHQPACIHQDSQNRSIAPA